MNNYADVPWSHPDMMLCIIIKNRTKKAWARDRSSSTRHEVKAIFCHHPGIKKEKHGTWQDHPRHSKMKKQLRPIKQLQSCPFCCPPRCRPMKCSCARRCQMGDIFEKKKTPVYMMHSYSAEIIETCPAWSAIPRCWHQAGRRVYAPTARALRRPANGLVCSCCSMP